MLGWSLFFIRPPGRMSGLESLGAQCAYSLHRTPAYCSPARHPIPSNKHLGRRIPCSSSPVGASLPFCSCRCRAGFVETARTRHLRVAPGSRGPGRHGPGFSFSATTCLGTRCARVRLGVPPACFPATSLCGISTIAISLLEQLAGRARMCMHAALADVACRLEADQLGNGEYRGCRLPSQQSARRVGPRPTLVSIRARVPSPKNKKRKISKNRSNRSLSFRSGTVKSSLFKIKPKRN